SILYIICVLGTFGINPARRDTYRNGTLRGPPIKSWNTEEAFEGARVKRLHMDSAHSFYNHIAMEMDDGPLRRLAVDMHRILFLHPDCPGADISVEGVDPLVTRNNFEEAIVAAPLALMEQYRREALLALSATGSTPVRAEQSAGPLKKRKLDAAPEPLATMSRYARYGKGPKV
ncbi:hypothetical protein GGH94_004040, partial [Coemansia aciculifera]